MTDVTSSTFLPVKPSESWSRVQILTLSVGACLLLGLLGYLETASLLLDPIEVAGETMWIRP
jgi:hypothetical protein